MNKIVMIIGAISICVPLLLMLFLGSMIGDSLEPLEVFATEEEAYEYQYIGSELGVPWDIVMLADGIHAQQEGKSGIGEYNPLETSLQFCVIAEEKFEWYHYIEGEDPNPEDDVEGEWRSEDIKYFYATKEILNYIHKSNSLDYRIAGKIIADMNKVAETKSNDQEKYIATLMSNPNYEEVLNTYIGLAPEYTGYVMELYEAKYLVYLYGYIKSNGDYEVVLPPPISGDVTRMDLAKVAVALINHPYLLGGKSSMVGIPSGPLDCSGYVDWVYIQCFGKGVSSGRLPAGVAMSGTAMQFYACEEISEDELKVGDLGFINDPAQMASGKINHVGIYIGTIDGQDAYIHCAGKYYGYSASPSGRVGISVGRGTNNKNNISGGVFAPEMKSCKFNYFRRPNFTFAEDED